MVLPLQSNKKIISWKAAFDPTRIYKGDSLLANAMRSVHITIGSIESPIESIVKQWQWMPATARFLSYLCSLKKTVCRDGKEWVYISQVTLCERLGFRSRDTIRRATLQLKKAGVIETTTRYSTAHTYKKTIWYSINHEKLQGLFGTIKNLDHQLLRYAQKYSRKKAVRNKISKEKSIVTTAGVIYTRMKESIIRQRFERFGRTTYSENCSRLKTYSAYNKSNNKKIYYYLNPADKFNFSNEEKRTFFFDKNRRYRKYGIKVPKYPIFPEENLEHKRKMINAARSSVRKRSTLVGLSSILETLRQKSRKNE